MSHTPTNADDIIDSRDVIARIAELESDREAYEDVVPWAEAHPDDAEELAALEALAAEGEGCADWRHGQALIRDDYFETYAQQLAEYCGMIQDNAAWPYTCIDWERAASELQHDYTSIDFDGVTYWVRS
jgi:hypothetical protein